MDSGSWYGFAWEGKHAGLVLNGGRGGCVAFTAGVVVAWPWLTGGGGRVHIRGTIFLSLSRQQQQRGFFFSGQRTKEKGF